MNVIQNQLPARSTVLVDKPIVAQLSGKFSACYGTGGFIAVLINSVLVYMLSKSNSVHNFA
jgi:hypothetical protein